METVTNNPVLHTGRKIERLRKAIGLTQAEFSARLGISKQAVSKIEADSKNATQVTTLRAKLRALLEHPLGRILTQIGRGNPQTRVKGAPWTAFASLPTP